MDLLEQLGLADAFEQIEHTAVRTLDSVIHGVRLTPVDFGALHRGRGRLRFMPQWDLLNMLAQAALRQPTFTLMFETVATGLIHDGQHVVGVSALRQGDPVTIRADLTVAADGRSSVLREEAGLAVRRYGVPIDVLWFRLGRPAVNPPPTIAYVSTEGVVAWSPFRAPGTTRWRC